MSTDTPFHARCDTDRLSTFSGKEVRRSIRVGRDVAPSLQARSRIWICSPIDPVFQTLCRRAECYVICIERPIARRHRNGIIAELGDDLASGAAPHMNSRRWSHSFAAALRLSKWTARQKKGPCMARCTGLAGCGGTHWPRPTIIGTPNLSQFRAPQDVIVLLMNRPLNRPLPPRPNGARTV